MTKQNWLVENGNLKKCNLWVTELFDIVQKPHLAFLSIFLYQNLLIIAATPLTGILFFFKLILSKTEINGGCKDKLNIELKIFLP